MICKNCGKEIPSDSLFCPFCGTKHEETVITNQPEANEQMKICQNCGAKIPADSRFCPECRAEQDGSEEEPHGQVPFQKNSPVQGNTKAIHFPKKTAQIKKQNKIIALAFASAIGLCFIVVLFSLLFKPTIKLNKYLTVSFDGYDTVGKAVVSFDYERYYKDMGGNTELSEEMLSECVKGSLDKTDRLSNGDTAVYSWECNDQLALNKYKCKLKYKDTEYTVEGLEKADTFDPFDGIKVVFDGLSSSGTAEIKGPPVSEAARSLTYVMDVKSGLSNGDTVTVSVGTDADAVIDYCIENFGAIPSPLTKEYTVQGLKRYVNTISDVSAEALDEMKAQAEDVYNALEVAKMGDSEKLTSFSYLGNYLLTNKNKDDRYNAENILYLVYKAKVRNTDSEKGYDKNNEVYWYISFYNLKTDPDGITSVDITSYKTPWNRVTFSPNNSIWGGWRYYGYESLDELYKAAVTQNADRYFHEDNMGNDKKADNAASSDEEAIVTDEENDSESQDGMVFPDSADRILSLSEIKELSDEDLRHAVNEIYARHGYTFKDEELKAYFSSFDWYDPTIPSDDFSESVFNSTEKENIETMRSERERRSE